MDVAVAADWRRQDRRTVDPQNIRTVGTFNALTRAVSRAAE